MPIFYQLELECHAMMLCVQAPQLQFSSYWAPLYPCGGPHCSPCWPQTACKYNRSDVPSTFRHNGSSIPTCTSGIPCDCSLPRASTPRRCRSAMAWVSSVGFPPRLSFNAAWLDCGAARRSMRFLAVKSLDTCASATAAASMTVRRGGEAAIKGFAMPVFDKPGKNGHSQLVRIVSGLFPSRSDSRLADTSSLKTISNRQSAGAAS